ncbi:MAG TPA: DUF1569 domain-containing protein [Tepidisphaeraceae bacterium]|jgi:hypothetical protein
MGAKAEKRQRRELKFTRIDEAIAEAERLAAAERAGQLEQHGNWTLGQTLGHLGTWTNFAFDGYPEFLKAPAPMRWLFRLFRNVILTRGFTAGIKIRGVPEGTVGIEKLPTDEGFEHFRAAMTRLKSSEPTLINPMFGKLSHDQWIQLNLRHAELHLSFPIPH